MIKSFITHVLLPITLKIVMHCNALPLHTCITITPSLVISLEFIRKYLQLKKVYGFPIIIMTSCVKTNQLMSSDEI